MSLFAPWAEYHWAKWSLFTEMIPVSIIFWIFNIDFSHIYISDPLVGLSFKEKILGEKILFKKN